MVPQMQVIDNLVDVLPDETQVPGRGSGFHATFRLFK